MTTSKELTRKLTILALLSAIAYILASLIRIPLVPAVGFLGYEPKDVILVIAGFIFGPVAPLLMISVIALLEGVTTSVLGPIGIPMNFIASVSFCCTAAAIYRKWRTLLGAAVGLAVGVVVNTVVMLLWNYALTPILMGIPREQVEALLIPGFLPFNLIKGTLNASIAMVLYKPLRMALDRARLLPKSEDSPERTGEKINISALVVSALIVLTCVLVVLSWQGVI
ncbi:MAG: ECF transporter S component [Oscillospiraceae bacterium]|nr:ECF transporter S component [Oscillospiraceae bacterium]MCL2278925.1 ECF transporter S component [Oscillospiraceae bacterium]